MLGITVCISVFLLVYFLKFMTSLKFLVIYERFFKTDAFEFILQSLDVASADHSC